MQSSIRTSPFYNSRNIAHNKLQRQIAHKQRLPSLEPPPTTKQIQNLREFESIKTLYRKHAQPAVESSARSRPSTYTKETPNENTRNSPVSENNASRDLFDRIKPTRGIGEPVLVKRNAAPRAPATYAERHHKLIQPKLPSSARSTTPVPNSVLLQRSARKQIRANLELYFRKKEQANRYSCLRPSSAASSIQHRPGSPRSRNDFWHLESPRNQRKINAPACAASNKAICEQLTVIEAHLSAKKSTEQTVEENQLDIPSTPKLTALSSDEFFDCQKVCSVESYKLVAEKDTNPPAALPKPNKITRKSTSKSRINTHWSFGPPPSDNLDVPFRDTRKLINLDPVFAPSPRRKTISSPLHRPRLINRCKRPSKTMTTTMMIPRYELFIIFII